MHLRATRCYAKKQGSKAIFNELAGFFDYLATRCDALILGNGGRPLRHQLDGFV